MTMTDGERSFLLNYLQAAYRAMKEDRDHKQNRLDTISDEYDRPSDAS